MKENVRQAVGAAIFCADASDRDDAHGLPEDGSPGHGGPREPELYDPSCEGGGGGGKADFARELESRALALDPRMKRVRTASLTETVAEERFRNSRGREGAQRGSWYFASVDSVAAGGGGRGTGGGGVWVPPAGFPTFSRARSLRRAGGGPCGCSPAAPCPPVVSPRSWKTG